MSRASSPLTHLKGPSHDPPRAYGHPAPGSAGQRSVTIALFKINVSNYDMGSYQDAVHIVSIHTRSGF